jgi:hypothetical protein
VIAFLLFVCAAVTGILLTHWGYDIGGFQSKRVRWWISVVGPILAAVGALGAILSAIQIFGNR